MKMTFELSKLAVNKSSLQCSKRNKGSNIMNLFRSICSLYLQIFFKNRKINFKGGLLKMIQTNLKIIYLNSIIIFLQLMITTRSITPKPSSLKYNYKTSGSSVRPFGQDSTAKKDSRLKIKNTQKTHHTSSYHGTLTKEWRDPLGQLKDENIQKCLDLADYHKKESMALKKKNELLEVKIKDQSSQIQQLKIEVANIKISVSKKMEDQIREENDLIQVNQDLEERFRIQQEEINFLRSTILQLKDQRYADDLNYGSMNIQDMSDPNEASRRKEIMKHYESIIEEVKKNSMCQSCKERESTEEVKVRYSNELRNLQEEIANLKEKELMVEVLGRQVTNKNDCIDYLTKQLATFEQNSVHLLEIIQTLEQKLEASEMRSQKPQTWRERNNSFHSFSDFRY